MSSQVRPKAAPTLVRRLSLILAVVVLLSVSVFGRQRDFGYCEQGGTQVATGGALSTNMFQGSFAGCTVTVYAAGTTNLATLYADNNGNTNPQSNPFTASLTDGYWFFYADNGRYDVVLSGAGISSPFTRGDHLLQDQSQATVATFRFISLPFNSSLTFDASVPTTFALTLTAAVTSSTVVNAVQGQFLQFLLCEDSSGNEPFAWPGNFLRPPPMPQQANACMDAQFVFDGTNWRTNAATGDTLSLSSNVINAPAGLFTLPSSTDTLAGLAASQTFTNKTLGAGTIHSTSVQWTEIAIPGTNPPANNLFVYAKTGDSFCIKNSSGLETCFGTGGGGAGTVASGAINQIARYAAAGTTVQGDTLLTDTGNTLTYLGTTVSFTNASSATLNMTGNFQILAGVGGAAGNQAFISGGTGTNAGATYGRNFVIAANAGTSTGFGGDLVLQGGGSTFAGNQTLSPGGVYVQGGELTGSSGGLIALIPGNGNVSPAMVSLGCNGSLTFPCGSAGNGFTSSVITGKIGFAGKTSGGVILTATDTVSGGTITLTLPQTLGSSGQTVTSNGAGVLSFGTLGIVGGGTNATSFTSNGTVYFDGTRLVSAAGSTGTFCWVQTNGGVPSWGSCSGSAGASTSLNNLAGVAFNVAIAPAGGNLGTANADLGSAANPIDAVWIGGAATNNIKVTGTATAARVQTLQDLTGTIALLQATQTWSGTQTLSSFATLTSSTANSSGTGSIRFGPQDGMRAGCVACNSGLTTTGTTDMNLIKGGGSSNGALVGDYLGILVAGPVNLQSNSIQWQRTNDTITGTTLNNTACLTPTGNVIQCASLNGVIGIVTGSAGKSGSAQVTLLGQAICQFDLSTVTAGDFVGPSVSPGLCADLGPSPTNAAVQTIGMVISNVSGTNWNILVTLGNGVINSSTNIVTNPVATQTIQPTVATAIPLIIACNAASSVDCFEVKAPNGSIALKVDNNGITTFGTSIGTITASQFVSNTSNPASSASSNVLRLATTDVIAWKNAATSGDVLFGKNSSDVFTMTNTTGLAVTQPLAATATTLSFSVPGVSQTLTIPDSGAASDTVALLNAVQVLNAKTIGDKLIVTEVAAPGNPSAGFQTWYAGTDHLFHCLTNTGSSCAGAGGGSGTVNTGTSGQLAYYAANGTTISGNANVTFSGGYLLASGSAGTAGLDLNTNNALVVEVPNDGTTGTTKNLLAKTTSANTAIKLTTADVGGIEGIVVSATSTAGNAQIAISGIAICTFDATAVVAGDYVGSSTVTAGDCHDLGANPPTSTTTGVQVLGQALTGGAGGSNQSVMLRGRGTFGLSGTTSQVTVTYSGGIATLSLPQSIATASTVQFGAIKSTQFVSITVSGGMTVQQADTASATSVTGLLTLRGGDQTGTANGSAGNILVRGGTSGSTGTGAAGNIDIRAGQATAAANLNGYVQIEATYIKGATYTLGNLQCFSASNTVADCATSATNFLGVALLSNGNAAVVDIAGSQILVNYDATVSPSAGWFACSSATTAGKVTAQAGACAAGRTVGTIEAAGTNVTSGDVTYAHY